MLNLRGIAASAKQNDCVMGLTTDSCLPPLFLASGCPANKPRYRAELEQTDCHLQKWVRPKERATQAHIFDRPAEGTSSLVLDAATGVRGPPPAVPLHDALEDQLVVDSALDRVEQGQNHCRPTLAASHED